MDIDEIVKSIIDKIVKTLNKETILFISGGAVNTSSIFKTLKDFKFLHYKIVMTDAAKNVIPKEYINDLGGEIVEDMGELNKAIAEAQIILAPVMTRNTLCKCASGVEDDLVSIGIARSLMMNKEIIAVKDSFDPSNSLNISKGFCKNSAYNNFILERENILSTFGIKFISSDELRMNLEGKVSLPGKCSAGNAGQNNEVKTERVEVVKKVKKVDTCTTRENSRKENLLRGVLTVKDIMIAVNEGEDVNVEKGSIITPLAKDYIYNNNINVNYY